jgi:DNA mismatch repair protein MutS2
LNPSTFQKLEFAAIQEVLASCCATSLGKHLALGMTPAVERRTVAQWLQQVLEFGPVVEEFGYPPLAGITDIRELVRAAAFPTPLEAGALSQIAQTLAASGTLSTWLAKVVEIAPTLRSLQERISDLSPIAEVIRAAIDDRGGVRDSATPRLAGIRRAIEDAKERIRAVFDRILRHGDTTRYLQYGGATFHNDRYVLPLKAEQRGRIQGIVHRSSDSGATLFVEPAESVELNNTIVRLRDEESKEITQVLRALSQRVQLNTDTILQTVRAAGVLDLIAAKWRYGKKRDCDCPQLDENGVLDLRAARHPLLVELAEGDAEAGRPTRQIVPIDVRLGDDFDVLMVTGPNTGGKTVTLKTVGLLALMTQCGMPIPAAAGSRLPVYRNIFVDIGDEQSIQQSLSTFSSHLENLLDILRHCGPKALVLIDELGAGTDPDEGAAIGQSIVNEILRLDSRAIVTTHLSALKAVAFTTERVDNACVEFDSVSLKPTYHLRIGEPGNSNALVIAERLGMPHRLIRAARQSLDNRGRALSKAIAGTLDSKRAAEAARKTAQEAAIEAERERERLAARQRELVKSQEAFARWTVWVNGLKPGEPVFIRPLRRPGTVVRMQLHKQSALVSAGAMDIEVPIRDIEPLTADNMP